MFLVIFARLCISKPFTGDRIWRYFQSKTDKIKGNIRIREFDNISVQSRYMKG